MSREKLTSITELPVAEIIVSDRLRPVSQAGVEALIVSIDQLGIIKDKIHVRKLKDGRFKLIAGGHRLEAARQKGFETIGVEAWRCSDDWARLMEVDDNLAGAEMNALDTAVFLAERKRLHEKLHPETAAGAFKGNQHTGKLVADMMSFTKITAEKFGLTDRHVRRLVHCGEALTPVHVDLLRGGQKAPGVTDLMEIAKIGEVDERDYVVEALSAGRVNKIAQGRQAYATEQGKAPAAPDPVEEAFNRLRQAFERAPKEAQRRFAEACFQQLVPLVNEAEGSVR